VSMTRAFKIELAKALQKIEGKSNQSLLVIPGLETIVHNIGKGKSSVVYQSYPVGCTVLSDIDPASKRSLGFGSWKVNQQKSTRKNTYWDRVK
jgi:hypothetical protein